MYGKIKMGITQKEKNMELLKSYKPSRLERMLIPLVSIFNTASRASTGALYLAISEAMEKDHPTEDDFLTAYFAKEELDKREHDQKRFIAKLKRKSEVSKYNKRIKR